VTEYSKQSAWRSWDRVLACLPDLRGRTVLDLGGGTGEQVSLLAARGAKVIGVDAIDGLVDGIWCSFAAAYFPALSDELSAWKPYLRVGGWIVLTEIDDLFGHEPMSLEARSLLAAYESYALRTGCHDVRMGSKLEAHLRAAGFDITRQMIVPDAELSPVGPASEEVISAWRERFNRMTSLRSFCGSAFAPTREDFLTCLAHPAHRSRAKVYCAFGERLGQRAGAAA
jgi:hypothetical protein